MAIETCPAFQFYVKEWRSSRSVQRMSFAERGIYLEMLCEQWENVTLPDSADEVAAMIALTSDQALEVVSAWPSLRRKFVVDEEKPGRIYNVRLQEARASLRRFKKVAKKGGKARAEQAVRSTRGTFQPRTSREPADTPADTPADDQPDIQQGDQPTDQPRTSTASASASASASAEEQERARVESERRQAERRVAPIVTDAALGERARDLVLRYPAIFAKCRNGALYKVLEARDFPAFVDMVSREADDRRIDRMIEVFLLTKAKDFLNSPGTPRQFLHMMPECDRLLRENGQ